MSRARPKDLAHDYLDPELLLSDRLLEKGPPSVDDIDALQQSAAECWLAKQHAKELDQPSPREALDRDVTQDVPHPKSHRHSCRGPEDDLDI